MSAPEKCPRCGSEDLHPRALPANLDRGAVDIFVCSGCGEQIGPVLPDPDPASAVVLPLHRPAAKLSMFAGPFVSLFAPLGCHLSAHAAARLSMSFDLMESGSRAEILFHDFAKELRGDAHV